MQIQPETIIWNQPPVTGAAKPVAEVFRLEKTSDDRINGSVPVWGRPKTPEDKIVANLDAAQKSSSPKFADSLAETEKNSPSSSFGFHDLIDMINPLQHIPIISTIYRSLTGDTISPVSRIVGDAAYGGVIGGAIGVVNAAMQYNTGKDMGDTAWAAISGNSTPAAQKTAPVQPDGDTTIALTNLRARHPVYNS